MTHKTTVYRGKPVKRVTPRIFKSECTEAGCDGRGYGGFCPSHTPKAGTGVLNCALCNRPVVSHKLTETCLDAKEALRKTSEAGRARSVAVVASE